VDFHRKSGLENASIFLVVTQIKDHQIELLTDVSTFTVQEERTFSVIKKNASGCFQFIFDIPITPLTYVIK